MNVLRAVMTDFGAGWGGGGGVGWVGGGVGVGLGGVKWCGMMRGNTRQGTATPEDASPKV